MNALSVKLAIHLCKHFYHVPSNRGQISEDQLRPILMMASGMAQNLKPFQSTDEHL